MHRTEIIVLVLSTLFMIGLIFPIPVQAQPDVFAPGSNPYGSSYGEWSAKWWKWIGSTPSSHNPATDKTGEFCTINQNMSEPVVFLAGTFGGGETRSCTVPEGKSILISPIDVIFTLDDNRPTAKTEEGLRAAAKADIDSNIRISPSLIVDGKELQNITDYRVQSPFFNLTVPADNVIDVKPNASTRGVSDGIFVMLKPLPAGEHTIKSKGGYIDTTNGASTSFYNEVLYKIHIK